MEMVLDNIHALWPFFVGSWLVAIVFTVWKPQRYFNSLLLMAACFFTMLFVSGLFGEHMNIALLASFLILMLLLFTVPLMLIINGLQLIKKESLSIPHLLSLFLGIVIGIGEISTVIYVLGFVDYSLYPKVHAFTMWLSMTVFYFSCLVLNFVVYSIFIQHMPHIMKFDYIIIHGCGLIDGEKMTKLLSNRVDKAIEIYKKCKIKPVIIPSGGKGSDEKISEAEAMRNYLLEKGIPDSDIIMEDASATTLENLINSKEIIMGREGGNRTALVSSNYHVYRCLGYARKIKLKCVGFGAKVALYFWPSALIREFVAVFLTKKFLFWSILGYLIFIFPVLWLLLK